MNYLSIVSFALICILTIFSSCGNEGDSARDAAVDRVATPPPAPATPAPNANPATPEPAQNASGVWHYTCPNGCAGGAGTATACPNCGNTLAHNAAYHNNPTQTAPTNANVPDGLTPVPSPNQKQPEPAQNAAGVWHYTCPSGCEGGAGTATACSKCGSTLAHNQAYHQ